jgi:uncharacterized protein (TIGR02246 family)
MNRFKRVGLSAYACAAVILLALVAWPPAAGTKGLGCVAVTEADIANLFAQWNDAVKTGNPDTVVNLYAADAILLPTVENGPLIGHAAIRGYFVHFLADRPSGKIDERTIRTGCNVALDAGLYTFTYATPKETTVKPKDPTPARFTYVYEYEGGRWLITHHHSSKRPK